MIMSVMIIFVNENDYNDDNYGNDDDNENDDDHVHYDDDENDDETMNGQVTIYIYIEGYSPHFQIVN